MDTDNITLLDANGSESSDQLFDDGTSLSSGDALLWIKGIDVDLALRISRSQE